MAADNMLFD